MEEKTKAAIDTAAPGWADTVLEASLFDVQLWRLVVALGLIVGVYFLRGPLAALFRRVAEAGARRTETPLDDKIGEALEPPLGLFANALSFFAATQILQPTGLASMLAQHVTTTLFAVSLFWALLRLLPTFGMLLRSWDRVLTSELACWTERIVRVAIWLIAGATILEIWGVRVAPIIAGFGLVGVAVALGAQDLFKNLISGALILTEKRFRVGDWVKIDGVVEGTVEAINFRSTKVRRFDKAPVYLPNKELADGAVTNFGEMTHRRIFWRVGLEYRSSAAQLRAIRDKVEAFIREDGRYLVPPHGTLLVRIDQFADSSIDLLVYCFTKTRDWADWLKIKEELLLFIKQTVEEAGTGIAFPSRTLYIEQSADSSEMASAPALAADGAERVAAPTAKTGAKPRAASARAKPKTTSRSRKSAAKTAEKSGPADGPVDGLRDAPEGESAGPTAEAS